MVARLNGIFDEKAAMLASLGQPHEASPASMVRLRQLRKQLPRSFSRQAVGVALSRVSGDQSDINNPRIMTSVSTQTLTASV